MEISVMGMVLITLGAMFLLGMPVFMSLAIASIVALTYGGYLPMSVVHNSIFDGLNIFPLLAIPCFVIAGTLMEYGNITNQIVGVVKQLVGRMHGGLGITTILACTFFAAISGSGPGTVAAVGTILVPAMLRSGYSKEYAAAASSSGGTIGLLIPPSNPNDHLRHPGQRVGHGGVHGRFHPRLRGGAQHVYDSLAGGEKTRLRRR